MLGENGARYCGYNPSEKSGLAIVSVDIEGEWLNHHIELFASEIILKSNRKEKRTTTSVHMILSETRACVFRCPVSSRLFHFSLRSPY